MSISISNYCNILKFDSKLLNLEGNVYVSLDDVSTSLKDSLNITEIIF